MIIPPVSIRAVRPCDECVFLHGFDDCSNDCYADRGYSNPDFKYYHRWDSPDPIIADWICSMNMTAEEMQLLIDQHNQKEVGDNGKFKH